MVTFPYYPTSMGKNAAFYERFADIIRKSGKSQTEIAAIMGVSQSQVNRILGGVADDVKLRDGLRLCQALGISPWFLAFGEEKAGATPPASREIDVVARRVDDLHREVREIVRRQATTISAVDKRLDELTALVRKRRPS